MGLLDKAKQAAQQAAEAAKKGTAQVQGKIEHAQTRKRAAASVPRKRMRRTT